MNAPRPPHCLARRAQVRRAPSRPGFTLAEAMVSTAVMGILMAGMAGTVAVSTRALRDGTSTASRTTDSAEVVDQITADLAVAQTVLVRTSNLIEFTVPDRDGDMAATPETIKYSWGGQPGDPLLRTLNAGTPLTLLGGIQEFRLDSFTRTVGLPPPTQGAEVLLMAHDNAPGAAVQTYTLTNSNWAAQYFYPTFPANTVSWSVTKVKLWLERSGTGGNIAVQIRSATSRFKPGNDVYKHIVIAKSTVPTVPTLVEVAVNGVTGLDPRRGAVIIVRQMTVGATIKVHYEENGSPMTANTHYLTTSNTGSTWSSPNDTQDLKFHVLGQITTR